MRSSHARWILGILLTVAVGGCAGTPPPPPPAVDEAAISATIDSITTAFFGAVTARETTLVVNFYADDAHVMPANAPRADGKEAIRQAWVAFLSSPGLQMAVTPNTKLISEAGDLVVDLGSFTMSWQDPKGGPMSDTGKYVTVFQKVNDEWKIVVDTFNSDKPAPGQ